MTYDESLDGLDRFKTQLGFPLILYLCLLSHPPKTHFFCDNFVSFSLRLFFILDVPFRVLFGTTTYETNVSLMDLQKNCLMFAKPTCLFCNDKCIHHSCLMGCQLIVFFHSKMPFYKLPGDHETDHVGFVGSYFWIPMSG